MQADRRESPVRAAIDLASPQALTREWGLTAAPADGQACARRVLPPWAAAYTAVSPPPAWTLCGIDRQSLYVMMNLFSY